MFEFEAKYDEIEAAEAERTFYVRSMLELRPWETFGPPGFFALVVAAGFWLGAKSWFIILFSAALLISLAGPPLFYFLRPRGAAQFARKHPIRQFSLTAEAIRITAGDWTRTIPWSSVNRIWEAGDSLILVVGKFVSINIPRRCLPSGAEQFIFSVAGHKSNDA